MEQQTSPDKILQTGLAFWPAKVLLSAVEMEVFTELAKHPEDCKTLQARLGLHPRSAHDFFDTLVALGFLERSNGMYRNTSETDLFLDKKKPTYIGGILEMANHRLFGFWNHLTEALRTGQPQNEVKQGGESLFSALYSNPERLKGFLHAMTGISRGANLMIARKFPWSDYKTAADVGTAQGDLIVQVLLAHPHMNGIGFDLPQVEPIFEEYVEQNRLQERLKFASGDFFKDRFPEADVIMMGHILHDWGLDDKRMLIEKAYKAIPQGGALIVYDSIIDDDRSKNVFGLMMSLNMLIETTEGFDYTGADCMSWMRAAGFRETRTEHLVGPDSMVIGIK
jgi:hypothetical protein